MVEITSEMVEQAARAMCADDERYFHAKWKHQLPEVQAQYRDQARIAIAAVAPLIEAQARAAAIEEAAKVAADYGAFKAVNGNIVRSETASDIAASIRALSPRPVSEEAP